MPRRTVMLVEINAPAEREEHLIRQPMAATFSRRRRLGKRRARGADEGTPVPTREDDFADGEGDTPCSPHRYAVTLACFVSVTRNVRGAICARRARYERRSRAEDNPPPPTAEPPLHKGAYEMCNARFRD